MSYQAVTPIRHALFLTRVPVWIRHQQLLLVVIGWLGWTTSCQALEWKELTQNADVPTVVAFTNQKTPPKALPFLPDRKKAMGFWAGFTDPKIIAKLAETCTLATDDPGWEDTGCWMHTKTAAGWVSLPVFESKRKALGCVTRGESHFVIHSGFWKNLQPTRPESAAADTAAIKAKTGSFNPKLGERVGTAQSPDDRGENPFYKYDGDATKETAGVFVPPAYDGSEAYGLIVDITPSFNITPKASAAWTNECIRRKYIWIGPGNIGNNQPATRRVWLAQQARAWALYHYRIDPARCIIAGSSNGGDAASATAASTPFGFNAALLFCPATLPAIDVVPVPMEGPDAAKYNNAVMISPLSSKGTQNIKKNWRFAYIVGTKDSFLPYCRSSVGVLKKAGVDCKIFEIPNMGHGVPPTFTEYFDFLESPREGNADKVGGDDNASKTAINDINKYLSAKNTAKARERLAQVWNNYPSSHSNPDLLVLIGKMEAMP